jgi:hypothetical protein
MWWCTVKTEDDWIDICSSHLILAPQSFRLFIEMIDDSFEGVVGAFKRDVIAIVT